MDLTNTQELFKFCSTLFYHQKTEKGHSDCESIMIARILSNMSKCCYDDLVELDNYLEQKLYQ